MGVNAKTYLDLTGLQSYDTQIKAWANSANQIAYKTVKKSVDGNNLLFFKKPNAVVGTDTPDETIALGSAEAATKLAAMATLVGATWVPESEDPETHVVTPGHYEVTFDSSIAATTIVGAVNEVLTDLKTYIGDIPSGATATTVIGYIAEKVTAELANLNGTATIASESDGVVTLKAGVIQTDGEIDNSTASDITLAKVATTGDAEDVAYDNTSSGLTATNAQAAIDELAQQSSGGVASKTIYLTDNSAGQSAYAKVYKIWQGANAPDAETDPASLIGTINIPLDKVVQSGEIVEVFFDSSDDTLHEGSASGPDITALIKGSSTPTSADAGKYIKLTLQNVVNPLYIFVKDLADIYTGGTNSEATVTIDANNEITVAINDVAASKITYIAADATQSIARESVGAALTRLDADDTTTGSVAKKIKDALDGLDTSSDVSIATYTAGTSGAADVITIKGSVKEENGVIAQGTEDDITLSTITTAEINALFS